MSMSTLPIWAEILILGMVFFVFSGMFAPYVSAKDQEKARRVERFFEKMPEGGLVPITIRSRVDLAGMAFYPLIMLLVVSNVAFFIESFATVSEYINPFLLIMMVIVTDFMLRIIIQAMMSLAATVISSSLEKYYRRTYYVDVKLDTEFDKIGIRPDSL